MSHNMVICTARR